MSFTVQDNIPGLLAQMRRRGRVVVSKTTHDVEAEIKLSMAEPKHGRTYKRGQKTHQASAPGEAPAIDFSHLVNSIQTHVEELEGAVGTNAEQGPTLEFGGTKIAARPFLAPAIEKVRPEFEAATRQIVEGL
jgi:phage gpG-like protein